MMKYEETNLSLKFFNGTDFYAIADTPKGASQFQALSVIRSNDPNIIIRYKKEKSISNVESINVAESRKHLLVLNLRSSLSF